MQLQDAFDTCERLTKVLNTEFPEAKISAQNHTGQDLFWKIFRSEVPGKGLSKKSGIYFITDQKGFILDIGKAGEDNFGAEINGKFRAATSVTEKDVPYFGNSPLANWAPDDWQEIMRKGFVKTSCIEIEPRHFASTYEVFIQAMCEVFDGKLPPRNFRIG